MDEKPTRQNHQREDESKEQHKYRTAPSAQTNSKTNREAGLEGTDPENNAARAEDGASPDDENPKENQKEPEPNPEPEQDPDPKYNPKQEPEQNNNEDEENEENDANGSSWRDSMLLKIILPFMLMLLAAASVFHFVHHREPDRTGITEPTEEKALVEAAPVREHDLEKSVSLVGSVEPVDQRMVIPEMAGVVDRVHVEEGEEVEKGQVLAELEDDDYRLQVEEARSAQRAVQAQLQEARAGAREAEVAEAESAVDMARENKKQAEKELERAEELHEDGFATDQQVEMAELEYTSAQEQLKTAEAALDTIEEGTRQEQIDALQAQVDQAGVAVRMAEQALERTQITAPADGTLAVFELKEGEMADGTAPAAVLLDTENIQVITSLPEFYVNQVQVGDKVLVEIPSARADPLQEQVQRIGELPPDEARSYPMEVTLSGEGQNNKVMAGMFARTDVTVDRREDILAIPRHALVEGEEELGVYVFHQADSHPARARERNGLVQGTVELVNVHTGISEKGLIQVKEGLQKGDRIVVAGQEEVSSGDQVWAEKVLDNPALEKRGEAQ